MAKTYLDQLVDYPAKVISRISEDKYCVGLIVNKNFDQLTDEDFDKVLDENVFDYQYVDNTTQESAAYIWAEVDVDRVSSKQFKNLKLYVTVACHKSFMKLDGQKFKGMIGNRRDNIVRYVDRLLNNHMFVGLGLLKLESVKPLTSVNGFTAKELTYDIPDFHIVQIDE